MRFKELQRAKADQRVKQPQTKRLRKRRHKKRGTQTKNDDTEQKRKLEEKEENWKELTQYFGMKDKFEPPPCNRPPPKSGLEKSIESAIAEGDYGTAEELSDRLATRELGVKIAQAADCRDFTRSKREAEASQAARKRRKQIAWGYLSWTCSCVLTRKSFLMGSKQSKDGKPKATWDSCDSFKYLICFSIFSVNQFLVIQFCGSFNKWDYYRQIGIYIIACIWVLFLIIKSGTHSVYLPE
nr:protein FAM204A isoform X3 [Misgurnus anguillicaudatus]